MADAVGAAGGVDDWAIEVGLLDGAAIMVRGTLLHC